MLNVVMYHAAEITTDAAETSDIFRRKSVNDLKLGLYGKIQQLNVGHDDDIVRGKSLGCG